MKSTKYVILFALLVGVIIFYMPTMIGSKETESSSADNDFPVVIRIKGGMLEVASVTGTRNFSKAKDPVLFGTNFPVCRERASWSVPYKITYRVKLEKKWSLRFDDGKLLARVPELAPSLPVAIDTGKLKKGAQESCWFVPDLGTRDRALNSISDTLKKLALNQKTKNFARQEARKTITEFLRTWAFNQTDYPDVPADVPIKVIFPGE